MRRPRQLVDLDGVLFLRRDLIRAGHTDASIAANVRAGIWHRARYGAYVDAQLWGSLSAADRHRVLCRAVLRTSHPSTVLTHVSSVIERGGPVWNIPLNDVHTTRSDGRAGRRHAGKIQHRGVLPSEHVEMLNGVPVSTAARSAVELTTITDVETALVSINAMLHNEDMGLEEFATLAHDLRFWPRSLATDLVVRLANPRVESPGESRFDYLCFAHQLPRPTCQVAVVDETGFQFARVDFAWPAYGVFLEFDGKEKYTRFRHPGETLDEFLMREKKREERICLLTGWVCIRISWADLGNPAVLAPRIRRLLEARRPRGA